MKIDMTERLMKHTQPEFHYLLVNVFEWRSGTDLHALMQTMDKLRYNKKPMLYWVWYVPGDKSASYEISFYQPQVEGSFVLDEVAPKRKSTKGETK
jgi:hypothetical protein